MDKSIYEQLKNLKIDVSGTDENSINAWNNNNDTAAFFNWFTTHLNESNILEPSDNEEYKFLVDKGLLHDGEYNVAIADVEKTHSDLFDLELNKSQINIIKLENDALKEYERKIDDQIQFNKVILNCTDKEIRRAKNKMDILNIKYEQTYNDCIGEARTVDLAYSDLQMKVYNCLQSWNKDGSIFSLDNKDIKKYKEVISVFLKKLDLNSETCEISELETLKRRLYHSVLYSNIASIKEKQLESEVTFYKDYVFEEKMLIDIDDQRYIQDELSIKLNIDKSLAYLQDVILNFVQHHIDKLNIIKLEQTIIDAKKKCAKVREIENILTNILANKNDQLNLYEIIGEKMNSLDDFLKDELFVFVTTNLMSCINRTEVMKKQIEEQQKPIENQNNKLIQIIVNLLSAEKIAVITPEIFKNIVKQFYGTIFDYEKQLFFHNIESYTSRINILHRNNYIIKKHLKSESNNEIILCPLAFKLALGKLRDVSKEADDIIKQVLQCRKSTDATLRDDKWLRIGRQLWMCFLVNPAKMTLHLKEIVEENNKRIANQINTDNKIIQNAHMYMND